MWQSIETCDVGEKVIFVARAKDIEYSPGKNYTTDPYCVWKESSGKLARWPHHFPPNEWIRLP